MPAFGGGELLGELIFGSVGFVAFIYGKRMHVWKPILLGLALMGSPYFISNEVALYSLGTLLTATLFLWRN